ncbi:hypothetical protein [Azospirillum sp. sgz302134]
MARGDGPKGYFSLSRYAAASTNIIGHKHHRPQTSLKRGLPGARALRFIEQRGHSSIAQNALRLEFAIFAEAHPNYPKNCFELRDIIALRALLLRMASNERTIPRSKYPESKHASDSELNSSSQERPALRSVHFLAWLARTHKKLAMHTRKR